MELNIKQVKIKIEFSFLLIIAVVLVLENDNVLYVLLFSCLHELGHLSALYLLGGKADSITFSYYGIGLKHSSDLSYLKEFIFLSAGIAVNAVFVVFDVHRDINLALLILNSLPIFPLDMGRIIKILLNNILSLDVSDRIFNCLSVVLIIAFAAFSVYTKSMNLILISIYMFIYWLNRGYI